MRDWEIAKHRMRHPLVGSIDVLQRAMPVPGEQGQRTVVVTAQAGSSSQAALALLAQATHQVCPYSNATRGNIDVALEATV